MWFTVLLGLVALVGGVALMCRPELALFGSRWQLRDGAKVELSVDGRAVARLRGTVCALIGALVVAVSIVGHVADRRAEREQAHREAVREVWGVLALPDDEVGDISLKVLDTQIPVITPPEPPELGTKWVKAVRYGVVGDDELDPEVRVDDELVIGFHDVGPGDLVVGVHTGPLCSLAQVQVWESDDEVVVVPVHHEDEPLPRYLWSTPEHESSHDRCGSPTAHGEFQLMPVTLERPLSQRSVVDGRSAEAASPVRQPRTP